MVKGKKGFDENINARKREVPSLGLVYAYFTTMAGTTPVVAAKVLPLSTVPS